MHVSTTTPTLDRGPLEMFAGLQDEGGDLVPQIVRMFVADTDKSLAEATNAISDENLTTLRWIAHNLVGSCGTIGAARMRALAMDLEETLNGGHLTEAGSNVQKLVEEFGLVRAILGQYTGADTHRHS